MVSKTHNQKTIDRLAEVSNSIASARGELYNPWLRTNKVRDNPQWSNDQILSLLPAAVERAYRACEKAQQEVIDFMQDLRASERV